MGPYPRNIQRVMAYLFNLVAKGKKVKWTDYKNQRNDWLRKLAQRVKHASFTEHHLENAEYFKRIQNLTENSIGKMYTFAYDPKWKAELPYYDIFPLIFPIEYYSDGLLGINMHYLPPILRAKLMDALYETLNNDKYNKTTRLQISYGILKSASRFKYFKPCIHRYLFTHLRSPFVYISPDEWDIALMLPTQKFEKSSSEHVWAESRAKV